MPKTAILFLWAGMNVLTVMFVGAIYGTLIGVGFVNPFFDTIIVICLSILHPGGWMSITGLILAMLKRNSKWLFLAFAGAVLTGLTVPHFVLFVASIA